jgi:geranylgeranyl diphosphate synthase type II
MATLFEQLERRMLDACDASADVTNPCLQAAREHFAAGGSRVRARICFDAGLRLHLDLADALCLAAVCELLHNASLVQDDLLDRTTLRRGEISIWRKHGDTIAVCTGDLMLSAAYSLLGELSTPRLIAPALRLVHRRTSEVILGQAVESVQPPCWGEATVQYDRLAKGKSASLLSLSLELPLLLSDNSQFMSTAHAVASDFAVAYQIVDDLADIDQDLQEGSSNLFLLLIREGLTRPQAFARAITMATARLTSATQEAKRLPNNCARTLLDQAAKLANAVADHKTAPLAIAGV